MRFAFDDGAETWFAAADEDKKLLVQEAEADFRTRISATEITLMSNCIVGTSIVYRSVRHFSLYYPGSFASSDLLMPEQSLRCDAKPAKPARVSQIYSAPTS